jgi:threonine/homoserine/homoserine lactone efflux protein
MKLLRIFFTGMLISFLGSLPLGTLNVAAMQIAVSDGVRPAIYFSIAILIVEVAYVRVSLVAMKWVFGHQRFFRLLEWITVVIILALAASSFVAASDPHVKKNILLSGTINRFWLGIIMSALNPVQIPFWFGWSTVLLTRKVIEQKNSHFNTYIAGIGTGTFIASLLFIYGGRLIVDRLDANQQMVQLVTGCIFLITAIIMAWKTIRKRSIDPAHPG